MAEKTLAYRIAHVITWLLLTVVVVACVCMLALLILQVVSQFELAILPYELFQLGNLLGSLFMWLFWSNYILLMLWAAFTNQSLQDVSPEELYHGPVMAALWFIIPLASLWKPYEVVTELYKASRNPMNWHNADRPGITGWWWATRILLSFTGIVANYASKAGGADSTIILFLRIVMVAELCLQFIVVSKIGKQRFARGNGLDVEQVF